MCATIKVKKAFLVRDFPHTFINSAPARHDFNNIRICVPISTLLTIKQAEEYASEHPGVFHSLGSPVNDG